MHVITWDLPTMSSGVLWDMTIFPSPSTTWHSAGGPYSHEGISHPPPDCSTEGRFVTVPRSCCLLRFSIVQINLPFCPGPSDSWEWPWVACPSGTMWVSLGRGNPTSVWIRTLAHFFPFWLAHGCCCISYCVSLPCLWTRTWSQGVTGQGKAGRICLCTSEVGNRQTPGWTRTISQPPLCISWSKAQVGSSWGVYNQSAVCPQKWKWQQKQGK